MAHLCRGWMGHVREVGWGLRIARAWNSSGGSESGSAGEDGEAWTSEDILKVGWLDFTLDLFHVLLHAHPWLIVTLLWPQ